MLFKKNITVLIISATFISCIQSQETITTSNEGEYPLLLTDLEKSNLKGKVKIIRTFYEYNYSDTLSSSQKNAMDFLNDNAYIWYSKGYRKVDRNGFFIKSSALRDSINEPIIDTLVGRFVRITKILNDIDEKSSLNIDKQFKYPVENPHPVRLNRNSYLTHDLLIRNDSTMYSSINEYVYKFNKSGYPVEERKYMGKDGGGKSILDEKKHLDETVTFNYDTDNKIMSKHYTFNKEGIPDIFRLTEDVMIEEFYIPISRTVHYEYAYDEKNRINEVSFFVNNQLYKKETYTYHDEGWVSQREMFIPGRSFFPGVRWRIIQEFNEHGDIIKARSYDRNETLHNERFYEYEYDEHNNWIKCYLHLENEITDPPTAVGERIIEYYEE